MFHKYFIKVTSLNNSVLKHYIKKIWNLIKIVVKIDFCSISILFNEIKHVTSAKLPNLHANCNTVS